MQSDEQKAEQLGRMMAMMEVNADGLKQVQATVGKIFDRLEGLPCTEHATSIARFEEQCKAAEKSESKSRWLLGFLFPALMALIAAASLAIGMLR